MNKKYLHKILEHPHDYLWTVQGFGKMSTNITPNARLHIWDRVLVNPRVPAVHSHSFNFHSVVIVGCMRNLKLAENMHGNIWNKVLVSATEGLLPGSESLVRLQEFPITTYREGEEYKQTSEEIHWSLPDDGTVTLVEWDFAVQPQAMQVFWRGHIPWADAKPRKATREEILNVTQHALKTWF